MRVPRLRLIAAFVGFVSLAPGAEDPLSALVTEHFDTNSDGRIDTGEWQNGLDTAFDGLDDDSDGALVESDLDGFQSDLSQNLGDVAATLVAGVTKRMLQPFDTDQDTRVSREEFIQGCLEVFKKLDGDTDGSVTAEELLALPTLK